MDEKVLKQAVEDISVIKGVIDRTGKTFISFSRIFIYWGALFILNSIITWIMIMNKEQMMDLASRYPLLNLLFPIAFIGLMAAIIYWSVSKKIPLVGLEKHLMIVWLLIIALNVIPPKISIDHMDSIVDKSTVIIQFNNFSVMFFSLAIALIVTSLFTGHKQLKYLGVIYIGISLIYAYTNLPIFGDALVQSLYFVSLPFTFLYTGFFLKSRQARSE